jgi:hypothetical protein
MALRSTTTTTEHGIVGHGRPPLALAFLLRGHLRRAFHEELDQDLNDVGDVGDVGDEGSQRPAAGTGLPWQASGGETPSRKATDAATSRTSTRWAKRPRCTPGPLNNSGTRRS